MNIKPVEKREYRAFLSHSSNDKPIADKLYHWLTNVAGMEDKKANKKFIWYDKDEILGGDAFIKNLENGIPASRSLILLWSKNASQSVWVRREIERAYNHQAMYPEFRIIPIRIDETPLDGFLSEMQAIPMLSGELSLTFCTRLLKALYPNADGTDGSSNRDIYVSYGWHEPEQPFVRKVSRYFVDAGFRLIGDAQDQPKFKGLDSKTRIQNIMLTTGGFIAIVPYRNDEESAQTGNTSKYILREIEWANEMGLPTILIKDPQVVVDQKYLKNALCSFEMPLTDQMNEANAAKIKLAVQELEAQYLKQPKKDHYVFYSTDIQQNLERTSTVIEMIQRVTAMPCKIGEDINARNDIYQIIINDIKNAFVMIADLTDNRPNILIESGIAIGADVHIFYVQSGERHRPPVMLGDPNPKFFKEDYELLGIIHKIVYPYRRKVLNSELK